MGEMIDITTVPKADLIFYKITSGSLRFQIKGPSNASVGLARRTDGKDIIWFVFRSDDVFISIDRGCRNRSPVRVRNILSAQEFKEFWLQWHNNIVSLGRAYEEYPMIEHREQTCDLTYVTFSVFGNDQYAVQWRFELPPLLEQMRIKPISNEIPKWVSAHEQLPDNALIGGFEKENVYIIRASHEGSLTPGKFIPSQGVGYISWGGAAHEKSEIEVLCGCDCMWLPCSGGRVPEGAIEAGYAESTNEKLYVGRAPHYEHLIPGKVQPSHSVCYIPYNDREIAMKQYEILVIPLKNTQCASPFYVFDHIKRMK